MQRVSLVDMTDIDPRLDLDRVLARDEDLEEVLTLLLRNAIHRQMWLFFLDDQDRATGVIAPCDDYPLDPHGRVPTSDHGGMTFAAALCRTLRALVDDGAAGRVVLIWERRGSEVFTPDELGWAGAMAEACRDAHVPLRAQFLLHDAGVRMLTPDDYAAFR